MPFKTKEEKRVYDIWYRAQNKDKIKIDKQINYFKNKEKNKEKRKQYKQKYILKNIDKIKIYQKDYMRQYNKHYHKNRKKIDISYRIMANLRTRLHHFLHGIAKSKHTKELIGCSPEFLKSYLESKFKPGMNWNNYGYNGWHIDHIIPCAMFDPLNLEDQKKCFNFTNFQPLWKDENFKKGDKI